MRKAGSRDKLLKAGTIAPGVRSLNGRFQQARSSVGLERFLDTEEVDGSNPFGPTILFAAVRADFQM